MLVVAAVAFLGSLDPTGGPLTTVALAAVLVGVTGATFDIIIDAYRIELLEPRQLGVGSGMSQYGWRIGGNEGGCPRARRGRRYGMGRRLHRLSADSVARDGLSPCGMGEPARHREPLPRAAPFRPSSRISARLPSSSGAKGR